MYGEQPPRSDLESVWDGYRQALQRGSSPFGAALEVASSVDRLGLAFAAGYSAALQTLVPDIVLPCALCVTEIEGSAPTRDQDDSRHGRGRLLVCAQRNQDIRHLRKPGKDADHRRARRRAGGRDARARRGAHSDRPRRRLIDRSATDFVRSRDSAFARVELANVCVDTQRAPERRRVSAST